MKRNIISQSKADRMARGIIIFGSAGSGKTTLGRMVAENLGFPYFDLDDYIWRKDTDRPFTVMYSREEKVSRLMEAISKHNNFVMAGSMDCFNAPFVPLFDLAVHLTADVTLRLARVHKREYEVFGTRILEGGDMYEEHQRFLYSLTQYDTNGSPNRNHHMQWAATLPCKVLYLSGEDTLHLNTKRILEEYFKCVNENETL